MSGGQTAGAARLQAKLRELRRSYQGGMPERIAGIRSLWDDYRASNDAGALAELFSEVHKIAGTATIYGFEDLGTIAQAAEENLYLLQHEDEQSSIDGTSASIEALLNWRAE